MITLILDPGIYKGVLYIHPCPLVCPWPVFKYLRDSPLVLSDFYMKLGHHKGTKVTEPDFLKKILWGHK